MEVLITPNIICVHDLYLVLVRPAPHDPHVKGIGRILDRAMERPGTVLGPAPATPVCQSSAPSDGVAHADDVPA